MINFLKSLIKPNSVKTFSANTGGNIGMMFAFTFVMLVGGLAVAIDLSNGHSAKQRLQNTTDAVALLAAREGIEDQGELEAAAQAYFNQAYPGQSGDRIEVVSISRVGDSVNVTTRNNIDTYFSVFFGRSDLDVSVNSSSTYSEQSLDIALVLDTTGSMGQNGKIETLKLSATRLMNTLESFNNDNLRVSIVPFAQYVNVGRGQANQNWLDRNGVNGNDVCVGSRLGALSSQVEAGNDRIPAIPNARCGQEIQPLTGDFNALKRSISRFDADGLTYAPAGLMWGWRTLEPSAPFTEASSSVNGQKVLVLMTDGANTRSVTGETHNGRDRADADNKTADICSRVKDSDITVYTIAFDVDDTGTRNLLQNCASNPDNFFNAQNASDLQEAFTEISATLGELRITS